MRQSAAASSSAERRNPCSVYSESDCPNIAVWPNLKKMNYSVGRRTWKERDDEEGKKGKSVVARMLILDLYELHHSPIFPLDMLCKELICWRQPSPHSPLMYSHACGTC